MATWDYDKYVQGLKEGNIDFFQEFAKMGGLAAQNAQNVYREILDQQSRGSAEFWYQGNTASKEAAAADFALRLAENGIGSLSQLGQITIPGDGENLMDQQVTINKTTGQPIPRPELLGRGTRGLDLDYNLMFAADGTAIPFTSNRESGWMQFRENALKPAAAFALSTVGAPLIGASVAPALSAATQGAIGGAIAGAGSAALTGGNVLQGALLGGAGGYLQGSNAAAANTAGYYDEITGQFIRDPNGLLPGPLSELTGTNIGSMQGYSYDPTTQTWTMPTGVQVTAPTGVTNTAVTGSDLLTNAGATTAATTGATTGATAGTAAGAGSTSTLGGLTTNQIANLLGAGLSLAGAGAAANAVTGGGGSSTTMQTPTQGLAGYSPEYYQQLQQYYNAYLPQAPRDVVSPLQQWYSGTFGQTPPSSSVAPISLALAPTTTTTTPAATTTATVPTVVRPPVVTSTPLFNNPLLSDAAYRSTAQTVAETATPAQKAEWYNSMIGSGYDNASIRGLVESVVGPQTDADWAYLQQLSNPVTAAAPPSQITYSPYVDVAQTVAATATPAQKAEWYNSMIGSGYSDAAIKSLVESAVGPQSSADWAYLQQLAAFR